MSTQSLISKLGFSPTFENVGYFPVVGMVTSLATIFTSIRDLNQEMENKKLDKKEVAYLTAYNIVNVLSLGTLGACFGLAKVVSSLYAKFNNMLIQSKVESRELALIPGNTVLTCFLPKIPKRTGMVEERTFIPFQRIFETLALEKIEESTVEAMLDNLLANSEGKTIQVKNSDLAARVIVKKFPDLLSKFSEAIQENGEVQEIARSARVDTKKL